MLKCFDHLIELPERRLHSPSQCRETLANDVWCRTFLIPEGTAKDLFIYIVLLETVHEDFDVLGKVRSGVSISLL